MTSDTQDLRTTEERTTQPDRIQLSAVQVTASALASVSAAVVASLFGVAGTVVGAGLVAIVSTTGSAIYSTSMKRTSGQLRRAREQLLTARAGESRSARAGDGSTAVLDAPGRRPRPRRSDAPADDEAGPRSRWRRGWLTVGGRRGLKWPALIGAAVLVFAIAIGVITLIEAVTQKPISAITGHSTSSSTTVGSLTGGSAATPTPSSTSTENGSGSDADNNDPSPAPTTGGSSGSGSGATTSSSPSARPSSAATSAAPKDTGGTTGGSSGGSGSTGSGSSGSSGGSGAGSGAGSGPGTGTGSATSGEIQVPVP